MKIAIIDERPIVRAGLEKLFSSRLESAVVLESDNAVHFHELYPDEALDVIIMSVGASKKADSLLIAQIRNWFPTGRVIVYDQEFYLSAIASYLKAGASGYLTVKADFDELIECVKCVVSGKKYIDLDILASLLRTHNLSQIRKRKENLSVAKGRLSPREYEIAGYLTKGIRVTVIAQELGRKVSTVSTIKKNIFEKLQVNNTMELVKAMESTKPARYQKGVEQRYLSYSK